MIVKDLFDDAVGQLKAAGIDEAENDVRILLEHYLGLKRNDLFMKAQEAVPEDDLGAFQEALNRRIQREPLQYITGTVGFMGLDFKVSPAVLIPRSDTEILVEEALKELHDGSRILDMCTGSGCILISLLHYTNDCSGVGVDLSEDALEIAEINSKTLIPDKDCTFIHSDLFTGVSEDFKCEMLVSNPPYIASSVVETLMPEVRDHEPLMALDGSFDGLVFYRRIVEEAGHYLLGGGCLIFEIGYDQGEAVSELMRKAGYLGVEVIKDYAGLDRVVKGIKPAGME